MPTMRHDGARPDRMGGNPVTVSAGSGAGRTVLIVRWAKDGTVNGPEQRAFAVINGRPAEAS